MTGIGRASDAGVQREPNEDTTSGWQGRLMTKLLPSAKDGAMTKGTTMTDEMEHR